MATVHEAAQSGNRLDTLRSLRDVLARSIDGTDSGRDVAALSRQLTDVLEQIETAEKASAPVKGTPLDELRSRRRARGAGAGVRERPASA